jgi:hypothetical protein
MSLHWAPGTQKPRPFEVEKRSIKQSIADASNHAWSENTSTQTQIPHQMKEMATGESKNESVSLPGP